MAKVSDTLLKIRIWAKIILLVLVLVYTLLFVFFNQRDVVLWYFPFADRATVPVLVALIGAFILGAMLAVLIRMVLKTVTQIRDSRDRGRTERLEREIADMRTKAGSLQTRK